jgi:hypothetical protein
MMLIFDDGVDAGLYESEEIGKETLTMQSDVSEFGFCWGLWSRKTAMAGKKEYLILTELMSAHTVVEKTGHKQT